MNTKRVSFFQTVPLNKRVINFYWCHKNTEDLAISVFSVVN